jgi:hypothetical protein
MSGFLPRRSHRRSRFRGSRPVFSRVIGVRTGKYLVFLEIESLEVRDRYFPRPGEESEEFTHFFEQHPEAAAAMEKWQKYSPFGSVSDISTDYVAVAEQ